MCRAGVCLTNGATMLMLHGNPTFLLIVVVVARKKDIDCVVNAAVLSLERCLIELFVSLLPITLQTT